VELFLRVVGIQPRLPAGEKREGEINRLEIEELVHVGTLFHAPRRMVPLFVDKTKVNIYKKYVIF